MRNVNASKGVIISKEGKFDKKISMILKKLNKLTYVFTRMAQVIQRGDQRYETVIARPIIDPRG